MAPHPGLRLVLVSGIVAGLVAFGPASRVARAELISTEAVLEQSEAIQARGRLHGFLERKEVRAELEALEIGSEEARARVDALSDAEVREIAGRLDQLPAGQSAVGAIVGAALIVFIILLITDIAGLTDVFPFVKKPPRN